MQNPKDKLDLEQEIYVIVSVKVSNSTVQSHRLRPNFVLKNQIVNRASNVASLATISQTQYSVPQNQKSNPNNVTHFINSFSLSRIKQSHVPFQKK